MEENGFPRQFLASFQKAKNKMIATNDTAYVSQYGRNRVSRIKTYTEKEIQDILENGSLVEQQKLSRNYFYKDGFYKQIIMYYATLLKYTGLLIPNVSYGKKITAPTIQKRYYNAVDYVEKMNLPIFLTDCARRALVDGSYYGVILQGDKNSFSVIDLPSGYACSRFKDAFGNDIVEFDISYFSSIVDKNDRDAALAIYPKIIKQAYEKWRVGKRNSRWVMLPSDIGICFPFFDGRPLFLSVIPTTIQYDKAVETEQKRELEEIRKIIVQKIPHLSDGRLLFEPDEAAVIHDGTVGMLKGNDNISVLTTYADVDSIVSKTASDANNNTLERMLQNIYSRAGVSSQIFASTGSSTLENSIKSDISLMMCIANKFARFVTNIVNSNFANGNISFKYMILPVGNQNEDKYIDTAFKLASSGYSLLTPAVAAGFSQKDILSIKDLENSVLKLSDKLIPLSSAYTQSSSGEGGRPTKEQQDKAEKTIENETSLDNQTGGAG